MALIQVNNVAIKGISASVPKFSQEVKGLSFFTDEEAKKFTAGTGIERRRIVQADVTTSDLCFAAIKKLIEELG